MIFGCYPLTRQCSAVAQNMHIIRQPEVETGGALIHARYGVFLLALILGSRPGVVRSWFRMADKPKNNCGCEYMSYLSALLAGDKVPLEYHSLYLTEKVIFRTVSNDVATDKESGNNLCLMKWYGKKSVVVSAARMMSLAD